MFINDAFMELQFILYVLQNGLLSVGECLGQCTSAIYVIIHIMNPVYICQ